MAEYSNNFLEARGADFKFERDFGHGIEFDYQQFDKPPTHRLRSDYSLKDGVPREVDIEVTNLLFSIGASHHYVSLDFGFPRYWNVTADARWGSQVSRGYNYESINRKIPIECGHLKLEIMRPVDKRDIKHEKDEREMSGDSSFRRSMVPGKDYTHGYWSELEAWQAGIGFFNKHFGEGWILVPNSWSEDVRPIYGSTFPGFDTEWPQWLSDAMAADAAAKTAPRVKKGKKK